ncbi:glycosyltransferase family 4 protein [Kangiella aquimarina]|nr:glycosyltransferase [Kangiella aquimarina]
MLPRPIIDKLKVVESHIVDKIKKILFHIKKFTKELIWKFSSIKFNKSFYQSNPFMISKSKEKTFIFEELLAGSYKVTIYHNDKFLNIRRNSIYVSFDFTTDSYIKQREKVLNLQKRETKTLLPFEYMGGGGNNTGIFHQSLQLNVSQPIKYLKASFKTQFDRAININEISITDVTPLELNGEIIERLRELPTSVLVYGDININTIDGSSIWLTSLVNILSRFTHVILLAKDNIKTDNNVLVNLESENITTLFPHDFRHFREFTIEHAVTALKIIDNECPLINGLVTRGVELALEVQKDKTFNSRKFVYVTDFYTPNINGPIIKYSHESLEQLLFHTDYLLYQTEEIKQALMDVSALSSNIKALYLPPTISSVEKDKHEYFRGLDDTDEDLIRIGYSGKIQPNWGVLELINEVRELRSEGFKIEIHIASGKISDGDGSHPGFRNLITNLIKSESFITFYRSLSRTDCQVLMSKMDYVWCYRPASFENSTLEVSTKLIESVAHGQKAICYPSTINVGLLKEDYQYYITKPSEIRDILTNSLDTNNNELAKKITNKFSFESIAKSLASTFNTNPQTKRRILFAGTDLKFISPFISHLKRNGVPVMVDPWLWGESIDIKSSQKKQEWADIIFCEWGLANAVWYSKNNHLEKPLYIRIHAQEVREKARKFAYDINVEKVSKFIFVSENIRQKALKLFNWPIEKTVVIPNFLEDVPFEEKSSDEEIRLGMVGIVPQTKRFDRAIELLEVLLKHGRKASLHIKGHRPENLDFMHAPGRVAELDYYYALYDKIKETPDLDKNIHFYEWGNDVALWYRNINVILSPSDNESFHYALADGVLAGALPVIWPWEGASDIYPNNWICNGTVQSAIEVIDNAKKNQSLQNRDYLIKKFGSELIYNELTQLIINEERD